MISQLMKRNLTKSTISRDSHIPAMNYLHNFVQMAKDNPAKAAAVTATGCGVAVMGLPVVASMPVFALLNGVGFGTGGIIGGSLAAGIQAGIGSVVGGSMFATLTSAGAGGYGVAVVTGAVQASGVIVTVVAGTTIATGVLGKSEDDDDDESNGEYNNETDFEGRACQVNPAIEISKL